MTDATIDRNGLVVLDERECWQLLERVPFGRLAFVRAGLPQLLPVNHVVDGRALLLATRPGGKLEAVLAGSGLRVAYEVDDVTPRERSGSSVVVHGRLRPVLDRVEHVSLERIGAPAWIDTRHDRRWLRLEPDEVTGRRLRSPTVADDATT